MCDCFHVVLPTWPGAPGSVSGRQLQPEGPDAETEENHSVTEGPTDEIIRPRPQGSSPVYEYTAEGAGFGVQENVPGRRTSGRRRSWWKRHSGDSPAFSSMSNPEAVQEATEVTLKTEVEAGATGYSVTGGGDQGIVVKQVLKDSPAATLFSLREGDQLLSTTIFFDDIKYEDALKILQYSEPYKVQFKIKRKLPASKEDEWAALYPQQVSKGKEKKQDKDVADGCTETPTKSVEADGDRERLISKSRVGRSRRPQDRLSWPKFQAIRSRRGARPRRSHSSSEAYERADTSDMSPTNTDTEAQQPAEHWEQKAMQGSQRKRFLNLRFRMGLGQDRSTAQQPGGQAQDVPAEVLEHVESGDDEQQDIKTAEGGRSEERTLMTEAIPALTPQLSMEPGTLILGAGDSREGESRVDRRKRKTEQAKTQEKAKTHTEPGTQSTLRTSWKDEQDGVESLQMGIARLSLQDKSEEGSPQRYPPDTQVRIRHLKTPKFGFAKENMLESERRAATTELAQKQLKDSRVKTAQETDRERDTGAGDSEPKKHMLGQEDRRTQRDTAQKGQEHTQEEEEIEKQRGQVRTKIPKLKMPTFGWSPSKERQQSKEKTAQVYESERIEQETLGNVRTQTHSKDGEGRTRKKTEETTKILQKQKDSMTKETNITMGGMEDATKEDKFKMPKLSTPSLGVLAPGKSMEASLEVLAPKVQEDINQPSIPGDHKTKDFSFELPSADLEVKAGQVNVKIQEGQLPEGELEGQAAGESLKSLLPKVQMPSLKIPTVDIKGTKEDQKGTKGEDSTPNMDVPSLEVDIQAPGAKLEGNLALADKDVATKDSKFKMPKFKMPSFGVSKPDKSMETSLEVSAPKVKADMALPSIQSDLKTTDISVEFPSTDLVVEAGKVDVKLPEGQLPKREMAGQAAGTTLKDHLPKVHQSIKMPKVDLKGPQVEIKGPNVDMKGPKGKVNKPELDVPSLEMDVQAPGARLEGVLAVEDKDMAAKDSKFKMPKFKMPSFGVSAPGKGMEASLEVSAQKVQADVVLPSIQGDLKITDTSVELPSADLEVKDGQVDVRLPEGQLPQGELAEHPAGAGLKGHLPKLQIPGIKMPKVEIKGPQVDIKGSKVDMKSPKGKVSTPELEVDIQAPGAKLEMDQALAEKDVATKDSKFKMPKFKMPSFGVPAPGKAMEASLDVSAPKIQEDVPLPSIQAELKATDVSLELPSAELDIKTGQEDVKFPEGQLPEGELVGQATGAGLKGHPPKVQMPSLKISKEDLKGPNVDTKGPKVDVKGPKGDVSTSELDMPSLEVDIQAPGAKLEGDLALAEKDLAAKDSKFKMPKFKMPSFGISAPGKDTEASLEVLAPKVQADVALPSILGDIETTDVSVEFPSADLEFKACQLDVKIQEGQMPKGELVGQASGASHKGHLHKVQIPNMKMTKVDLKGPQMEGKGPKGEVSTSELDMPSLEVDIKAPGAKLEGDLALADKDMAAKDSKFKMLKFKMPSFGVSTPGKSMEASVEVSAPKIQEDVPLPSIQAELKSTDVSLELPSAELEIKTGQEDVKFLEGQLLEEELVGQATGSGLKGHLPKVQMTSPKMPKVDLKGPQVDIKGPKVDIKGSKVDMKGPTGEVSTPKLEVDIQTPRAKLEGDLSLEDKDVAAKDSKFKMPKFKMPSFGVSAPGKGMEASVEVSAPKIQEDVPLPSIQAELKTTNVSLELPSAELEIKTGQDDVKFPESKLSEGELVGQATGADLKVHLPKVQMPSLKMPQVDLKGLQVDIKGPKLDIQEFKVDMKGPTGEVSTPELEVDIQAPRAKLEMDQALTEKDVATKDSKFKMPKFKMPSFGLSAPGKGTEASLKVSDPKVQTDVALPLIQCDLQNTDVTVEQPPVDLEFKAGQLDVKLPERQLPEGELVGQATRAGLKGHLHKVQLHGLKMPKVDLKGPQEDIKDPKVDVKGPKGKVSASELDVSSLEVDIKAPGAKLEGDLALADKDMASRDSKFKRPKFKMPSFGMSAPGKGMEASLKVSVPKVQVDVALPSIQGDKITDTSVELPSADLEVQDGQVDVRLPEGQLPQGELAEHAAGKDLKGHLPKLQIPGMKMPKVEIKGPQVDIKGSKVDMKSPKGKVSTPELEVDIQAPRAKLEMDQALAEKDVATKDSKFKMPKFKMPSFGVPAPGKAMEASLDVSAPKIQEDVPLPSIQAELKATDVSLELPSAELDIKTGQEDVKLPEGQLPEGVPVGQATGSGLKDHLPKVQMPSLKISKEDLKGPNVDTKAHQVDMKGPKGEVSTSDLDMPSLEVDIQAPGAKLEGDLALSEKDLAAKDSKFKMPKFKMPSFGVSAPSKDTEASLEVSAPNVQADVSLPSILDDIETTDVSVEFPSADLEFKACQLDVKIQEGQMPKGELVGQAAGASHKGHLHKVQMPSMKMTKVDLKGPQMEGKDPKGEVITNELDMPSLEVDIQASGAKLEGDLALADKDMASKDSKLKMHKFKLPSFRVSAPGKDMEASLKVSAPKVQADVVRPSIQGDLKITNTSVELPSADLEVKDGQVDVRLPEGQLPQGELAEHAAGKDLKGHLPKLQIPGIRMPKVEIKGPQVDIKRSQVDMKSPMDKVSTPELEVDIQAPRAKLEMDQALADKDVATKERKFKMPKFKMPSFGVPATSKATEASLEVSAPRVQTDMAQSSIQGDLQTTDVTVEQPSADLEFKTGQLDVKLPEGQLPEGEMVGQGAGAGLKDHLPKVQMSGFKMPKEDLKGTQVDIKGPKVIVKCPKSDVSTSDLDMPSLEVDFQAPGAKLEGDLSSAEKDVAAKDSKFKMPKFKMPSFGVSAPDKDTEASLEVSAPKVQADVALPSILGSMKTTDVSVEFPSADLEFKACQMDVKIQEGQKPKGELEGQAAGASHKGHLHKVQMPSMKMTIVDLKGPKMEGKDPKGEVSTSELDMPSMEVDIQAPGAKLAGDLALADKDVATKDSKFKMPKFKMPSFGVSAPGKSMEASVEVSAPKIQEDVPLPSIQAELKTTDVSLELPSAELEIKTGQEDVKFLEGELPEGELVGQAGDGLKDHLPKMLMPSFKMPKVDLKGPQEDIKGPKVDIKGFKVDMKGPTGEVSTTELEVDVQAPGAKLEGDLSPADKDMATKDSKFKMPKFKIPSFRVSAPVKGTEASLELSAPMVQRDVALSSIQGDLQTTDVTVEQTSSDLEFKAGQMDVKLPEGQLPKGELVGQAAGAGLKGHLPKVQMPGLKMPKVELKGPQGDIKGSKVDVKGPKGDVSAYVLDVPNLEVDIQAPGARLERDLALADKDVAAKDSKFKMPKFKMPSFGVSTPGKDMEASLEVSAINVQADVALSSIQGDLKITDTSVELPSAELEFKTGQEDMKLPQDQLPEGELVGQATGAELKGHLPKVQMPSLKMPQVDLKEPQVDIKGPKVDVKGPKGNLSTSELDMPSLEVDIQTPGAKLKGDLSPADKDMAAKDSKFKMPKFKMPSFGVSAPSKGMEASVEVSAPKIQEDVPLLSIQAELKTTDISLELPSAELEIKTGQDDIKFLEGELPEGELVGQATGAGLKDLLPKVQTPSLKMPKVDLKGPQVDIKGPKVDIKGSKVDMKGPTGEVSTPELEVDVQAPGAKLEMNQALAEKDVATKDSKFKMPKFKMPSFGVSAPGKAMEASLEVSDPKVQTDVALPLIQGDLQTTDVTIEQPSADLEFKAGQLDVKLLEGQLPKGELVGQATGADLKGHLPKVQMHRFEMPKVDLEGPKLDVKGPKGDVSTSELDVPSLEVDIQAPTAKLEMDQALADKDMAAKDSKFKMLKFKMPSFGVSAPDKSMEASLEVSAPKVQADVALPSIQGKLKTTDVSLELPSAELEIKTGQEDVKLPEGQLPEGDLVGQATRAGQKGHLPKVQMPSLKMSKVDLKGPQVDIKGPKMDMKCPKGDVSTFDLKMPSLEMDIQAPGAKLKGDLALADKDVATKDSKFKMPKLKMPSFGVSAPGKDTEASLEVSAPKVQADVALSSIQGDLKTTDVSMELPSAELEFKAGYVDVKLPEGQLPEGELTGQAAGAGLKGHLPKLQIPGLKMPKVDIKSPQVDLKGPQVDIKGSKIDMKGPTGEVSTPELEVDIQAPRAKLEMDQAVAEKDVATKDSKFKMPKFKMPSFGVSAPGKAMEASLEVSDPKVQTDVALPLIQGDLQTTDVTIEQPSADLEFKAGQLDVKLLEGQLPKGELVGQATGADLKGHLPKVQMHRFEMPKVDLEGPKLDVKGPKGDVSTSELDVPSLEVDIQAPTAKLEMDQALADKDMAAKDSKFKMLKFKMPSFGVSAPDKSMEASLEVSAPKVQADVALPSIQGKLKTTDVSLELPSAELEIKTGQEDVKLPEGQLPEGDLVGQATRAGQKGHLPKVQMPSLKMSKVDLKGPQVDIKGPKMDMKCPKGDVSTFDLKMPSLEMDIQAPGAKLKGDLALADKDVATKDSKFKMPKLKMPSFGVSAPGKDTEASLEVSAPKVQADVALSSIQGDLKTTDVSMELPSAELEFKAGYVDVKLPEGQLPEGELTGQAAGAGLKGHLPKLQIPGLKMPKVDIKSPQVDLKGPQVDIKGSKIDMKGPTGEVSTPELEVDIQAPRAKLEMDQAVAEKDVATKDSKFKMPKFKMPSFGVSAPGKAMEASLEVSDPKVQTDVALPLIQGDLQTTDVTIEQPSADLEFKAGQLDVKLLEGQLPKGELVGQATGADLKGHLPKVQMHRFEMPKVDLEGPKLDVKGPKGDVSTSELDVPSLEVDIQAPTAKLEMDQALADKDMAAKDSKFKMLKFKMPSFGVSAPDKSMEASLEVSAPKVQADVALPSIQGKLKTTDVSLELPSAELEIKTGQEDVKLPEGQLPEGDLVGQATRAGQKGHLPKVQMPSLKMSKVDLKGPQVDIKGPKMDMKCPKGDVSTFDLKMPSLEMDIQAPGAKLKGDLALADKDVATKDSKFKMPKLKMPSFGVSAPGKDTEASLEVSAPKVQADVALSSIQGDLKTTDVSMELPSAELEFKAGYVDVKLPEGQLPEGELTGQAAGAGLKGHLPKLQIPGLKMPKVDIKSPQVDLKGPQVDIKGSKIDMKGPTGEVSTPELEVDIQAPRAKLEMDQAVAEKDVATKDSKFKMPKFKMPSFGVSAPGKAMEASLEVSDPKVQTDVALPLIQGDLQTTDVTIEQPSADLEFKAGQLDVKLLEGQLPKGELVGQATGADLKGHLPKVQMHRFEMPKVDLEGPKLDVKGPKGDVSTSELDVPSLEVDIQAPTAKLEMDQALADKDMAAKDSKFKMLKFKMPSFGVSAPDKSMEASLEVSAPKVQADVALPSIQGKLKTTDVSLELPSAELEIKTGQEDVKLPEGQLPEGDLVGQATRAGQKGHLPKLQIPGLKMPKVDIKGPQVDLKGPQVDIKGSKIDMKGPTGEVSTPELEMDIQAPRAKLEMDQAVAEKDVATKDSKFKMPKFKMPSLGVSTPGKGMEASLASKVQTDVALHLIQGDLQTTDVTVEQPSADLEFKAGQLDVKLLEGQLPEGELVGQATGAGLKGHLPKVQIPTLKIPKVDLKGPQVDIKDSRVDVKGPKGEVSAPQVVMPSLEMAIQAPGAKLDGDLGPADKDVVFKDSKFKMPKFKIPSFSLSTSGKSSEPCVLSGYKVTSVPSFPPSSLDSPLSSECFAEPRCLSDASSAVFDSSLHVCTSDILPASSRDSQSSPIHPVPPSFQFRVTFPKFHKPKFAFEVPSTSVSNLDSGIADHDVVLSPVSPGQVQDSSGETIKVSLLSCSQDMSTDVPVYQSMEEHSVQSGAGATAALPDQDGKGSPFKLSHFQLPSLSLSPKKEVELTVVAEYHLEDPTLSVVLSSDQMDSQTTGHVSQMEAHPDLLTDKEGEKGKSKKPGFTMPRLALPKLKPSKGWTILPQGDVETLHPVGGDSEASESESSGGVGGGTGTKEGPLEGEGINLQLPQVCIPSLDFAKPGLTASMAKVEVSQCKADLPLPKHDPAVTGGSKRVGLEGDSASQSCGEGTAPTTDDPLQPSCRQPDDVPTMERPEEDATVGDMPADSHGRWFKMPKFYLPGFRRSSSKDQDGARDQEATQMHMSAATAPAKTDATAREQVSHVPGSQVEAGADVTASESTMYTDVLRHDPHSTDLKLHLPTARMSQMDLPTSEVRIQPAEGSLSIQMPGVRWSEPQVPPEGVGKWLQPETEGHDLAKVEKRTETWSSQPEGPLKLKASSADVPSQISIVNTGQLWEDSVLTVTFPKLNVPRFSFPAPSSEDDIFFPVVRKVQDAEASVHTALCQDGPGLWGASLLKAGAEDTREQPASPDLPLEASPVSKVRVHIQGAQGKSQEVIIRSRVTQEYADLAVPEAFSTQIVRESEIPMSTIQTPSYGFSLLKVKVPEPSMPASVCTVALDSGALEGSGEAPTPTIPGADLLPGDLQPEATEPFEMISASVNLPGLQTFTSEVRSGPQLADSGSDEEPAEILEFPDDSQEVKTSLSDEDRAPKEKPESKKSSGLLWSWLPSIGFSSVDETSSDSRDDARRSAPIQIQPMAQPDTEQPKKQERAGWFRFPKLGFSSPTKKSKSSEDEADLAEQRLQEEVVTFFDARESFSPEEDEDCERAAGAAGSRQESRVMVTSPARTELVLQEQGKNAGDDSAPRPMAK